MKLKKIKIIFSILSVVFFLNAGFADDYIRLNKEGLEYLQMKEYEVAREKFNQAIKLSPKLPTAYNNLGKLYAQKGELDKARNNFDKALELDPRSIVALNEIAKLYIREGGRGQGQAPVVSGIPTPAIVFLNRSLENSLDKETLYLRGTIYVQQGLFEKAVEDYNQALILDPDYSVALRGRQIAYAEMANQNGKRSLSNKQFDSAERHFKTALSFDPNFAKAYNNLGITQIQHSETIIINYETLSEFFKLLDLAIDYFERAVFLDPNNARYYDNRGTAYLKRNRTKEALVDYNRALELYGEKVPPNLFFSRGIAYSQLKEYDKAIEDYSKALDLNLQDKIKVYKNRGIAYAEIKDYNKAIEDYTQALRIKKGDMETYERRGDAYLKLGRFEKAEMDYASAMEHSVENDDYGKLRKKQKKAKKLARKQNGAGRLVATWTTNLVNWCRTAF